MTLFSYEIFDAVARQGSFNKAAQQLHLTPSAISHAIAVMEAELGFTLFNRGKNGVTMTSYGASLYPSIRAVLNSDEALQQSIARLNGLEKGKVKLGAFNSVCAGLLPQILKSFMASYPQIEVEVYQGTYDDVKEWLRTGQVDLAFLSASCREEFNLTELFWTAPLWMMKAFDADFIDSVAEKGQKLFERLNVMTNRQTAGFLVALAVGVLMLFSPMVGSYFELFALLKASPVIYFLCFCAGIATPFLGAAFFAAKAADVPHKNVPLRIPFLFLPAFFQGLLTFVLLGLESGRYIMLGTLVCFAAAGLAWKKMPVTRKTFLRISGALCLFALLFVPFQPNKYSFNTYGALPFDEAALHKAVSEGKAVYLNVSESGCLACQYNRYSMIHNGGYYAIRDGKLLVMTATYDNPFVRRLLQDAGAHILPADILFGPAAPQGRLLPSALKGAETTIAIRGIFAERD